MFVIPELGRLRQEDLEFEARPPAPLPTNTNFLWPKSYLMPLAFLPAGFSYALGSFDYSTHWGIFLPMLKALK